MTVALYGKTIADDFFPYLQRLMQSLQHASIAVACEEEFAGLLEEKYRYMPGFCRTFNRKTWAESEVDILLSIGGDGTFLDSVEYAKDTATPILGVNSGRLGFLANVKAEEIEEAVGCIASGRYTLEEREMLQLEVDGQLAGGFDFALNEVGVLKAATSSLLKIHAFIGEVYLTTYWADGLVVATPTGSTAYSLSGGGPIVSPDCRNIILTPICPHNLSMRPLVVPNTARIVLKVESRSGDFVLSMDSRIRKMADSHQLTIFTSGSKVKVVSLHHHEYYETLRNKLKWGEDKRNDVRRFD